MMKKFPYLLFSLLLAAFIALPGMLTHGQDGGKSAVRGQNQTGYVKSDEGMTSGTDQEAGDTEDDGAAPTAAGGQQGVKSAGGAGIVSDAGSVMPADYNIKLPPPTAKEAEANLARVLGTMRLQDAQSKLIGLRLLSAAGHYLGVPYQRDGRGDGVHGIDCSKLTRFAAMRAGLEPPSFVALAGAQYGYALKNKYNMRMISNGSLENAQPGDFLFFNWRDAFSRARPYSIGHVALYIGPTKGNAIYLIEAGDPVQKRWGNSKYLVGVGRIVKAP